MLSAPRSRPAACRAFSPCGSLPGAWRRLWVCEDVPRGAAEVRVPPCELPAGLWSPSHPDTTRGPHGDMDAACRVLTEPRHPGTRNPRPPKTQCSGCEDPGPSARTPAGREAAGVSALGRAASRSTRRPAMRPLAGVASACRSGALPQRWWTEPAAPAAWHGAAGCSDPTRSTGARGDRGRVPCGWRVPGGRPGTGRADDRCVLCRVHRWMRKTT